MQEIEEERPVAWSFKRKAWISCGLFALALAVCVPSLVGAGFTEDDGILIVRNQYIQSFRHLQENLAMDYFTRTPLGPGQGQVGYYRPLTRLSFLMDYALWGLKAWGFRLTNGLLHGLCVLLLLWLLWRLFGDGWLAVCAAALFAVHPIPTDAIVVITARSDLWMTAFHLMALYGLVRSLEPLSEARTGLIGHKGWLVASALLFGASLLGKESAVALVPLALVLPWFALWRSGLLRRSDDALEPKDASETDESIDTGKSTGSVESSLEDASELAGAGRSLHLSYAKKGAVLALGLSCAFGVYALVRFVWLGVAVRQNAAGTELGVTVSAAMLSLVRSVYFLLWPFSTFDVPHLPTGFSWWISLQFGLLLTVLGGLVWLQRSQRAALFGLCWMGAGMIPLLLSYRYINNPSSDSMLPMAGRFLYLPSLGACVLLGWGFWRLWQGYRVWRIGGVVVLVALGLLKAEYGHSIRNEDAVAATYLEQLERKSWDSLTGPERCQRASLKSNQLARRGDTLGAHRILKKHADKCLDKPSFLINLARSELDRGAPKAALRWCNTMVPTDKLANQRLKLSDSLTRHLASLLHLKAIALRRLKRTDEALKITGYGLRWQANHVDLAFLQCMLYEEKRQLPQALRSCRQALRYGPRRFDVRLNLAILYWRAGAKRQAALQLRAFLQLYPKRDRRRQGASRMFQRLCRQPGIGVPCLR